MNLLNKPSVVFAFLLSWMMVGCATGGGASGKSGDAFNANKPPQINREFRGVWVATVANIDWPSEPGLTTQDQQDELIAIMDRCVEMNLNAVVFQVRTSTDALYASEIEPWSAYLTGTQGQAPEPYYDPLAFAIEAAHERGLELHAWINPLRSSHPSYKGELVDDHISKVNPDAVPSYGGQLWMDPGHPDTIKYTMRVVEDLVSRYDLDGLHIDDYFYPYVKQDADGNAIRFPDEDTYAAYQAKGGRLDLHDWRRKNVDTMVEQMHKTIKRTKPWVKFGISPFGIWRPGHPEYVVGMDQYDVIFADAKKWLEKGWCDYFTPQLYWQIANPDQSFTGLLSWWAQQNPRGRHLWPGLYAGRTDDGSSRAFGPQEVKYQVEWTRILLPEDKPGHVHFSMKVFMQNRVGLTDTMSQGVYQEKAIPPAMPWLRGVKKLRTPAVESLTQDGDTFTLEMNPGRLQGARWLSVQVPREDTESWGAQILTVHGDDATFELTALKPGDEEIFVRTYDRLGRASKAVKVKLDRATSATAAR
ncbi:MAG: family 10 glycosylhydrolase [Planctomycetota bacterium]